MNKEIHEIWVNEDGTFDCESHGIKGEECLDKLETLLSGLDIEIEDFIKKKEFYSSSGHRSKKSKKQNKRHLGGKK